jgi:hypothetical protein
VDRGITKHWVLIETGANQAYVFGTNRLRHVVGASHLIHQVGTAWIPETAKRKGASTVLAISGKALLLVDDPAVGRAVINEVGRRALEDVPGLEVTGAVGPGFDPDLRWHDGSAGVPGSGPFTHVEALSQTYGRLEAVRASRPSAQLRDPLMPWSEVCRDSGYPAAGVERHPDGGYAAASVLAKSDARQAARSRMRELLSGLPDVVPENLDDLRHDGWLAVIHADGNGVGRVFTTFAEHALQAGGTDRAAGLSLDRHAELLRSFTQELEHATKTALWLAVHDTTAGQHAADSILPVVVGGDDVTVVCRARFALPLVRAFALAFEEHTALQPTIAAITGGGLTAAAGIAFVKPHHPFSVAYGLAEELTVSAKRWKRAAGRDVSALDLHVAFESTLTDLAGLRAPLAAGGLIRYGGPYVITGQDSPPAGPRDIARLDGAIRTMMALSSSMAHYLREGLAVGPDEYTRRIGRAARSSDLPDSVRPEGILDLAPEVLPVDGDQADENTTGPGSQEPTVRLLDALLLTAVARPASSAAAEEESSPASPDAPPLLAAPAGSAL